MSLLTNHGPCKYQILLKNFKFCLALGPYLSVQYAIILSVQCIPDKKSSHKMDILDKNKILDCFNAFPASFQTGMHWTPKIITY